MAHNIEYEIHGDDVQFVEAILDPQESVIAEAGSLLYMEDGIVMNTIFGDGSDKHAGIVGTLMGSGKRLLTGESLFTTAFTNQGQGKKKVAFAAPYPGRIIPIDLMEMRGQIICQRDAFLAAAKGVSISVAIQRRILTGIFGGEGFIMQKLEGTGLCFVHAGGTLFQKKLAPGESLRVDTGCVVAYEPTIDFDIQLVSGIKTMLFGKEGLFLARLVGPGTVWLQSQPFSHLAAQIVTRAFQGQPNRG